MFQFFKNFSLNADNVNYTEKMYAKYSSHDHSQICLFDLEIVQNIKYFLFIFRHVKLFNIWNNM